MDPSLSIRIAQHHQRDLHCRAEAARLAAEARHGSEEPASSARRPFPRVQFGRRIAALRATAARA